MHVFILGGTGSIGSAVVQELVERGHWVTALSRSAASDSVLLAMGAEPRRGDLLDPDTWTPKAAGCDAVIQLATTFGDDMAAADLAAMQGLMQAAAGKTPHLRLIYTGGCWLYGDTGTATSTEDSPFNPIPAFAWMADHAGMLLASRYLATAVIHPAMVYTQGGGGVFARFANAARAGQPVEIWGSASARWPLIERGDLARLYCDLLERPDLTGHFNAVAETGVPVARIAMAIANGYGSSAAPVVVPTEDLITEHGDWAIGPTLTQQMDCPITRQAVGWQPTITDFTKTL